MDSLAAKLALRLPAEARLWWGWHDGATDRPGAGVDGTAIGPFMLFMPLKEAAQLCQLFRDELANEGAPFRWQQSWLPLVGEERTVAIDCQGGPKEPAPVYVLTPEDPGPPDRVADSIGELVEWFIGASDCGAWAWLTAENRWDYDDEKLPPEMRIVGLL
jgi:cell wall assembly regulator SMI1